MPSRNVIASLVIAWLACTRAVLAAADTVDELLAADARTAVANEDAKAARAERAAREAAGLPPPGVAASVATSVPAQATPRKAYQLISIYGQSGHRVVQLSVDGASVALVEGGGGSGGYTLASVEGTCAKVTEAGTGRGPRRRSASARHAADQVGGKPVTALQAAAPRTVCFEASPTIAYQGGVRPVGAGGVGGALPPPLVMGSLPPPPVITSSAVAGVAAPAPSSIQLPNGGLLPVQAAPKVAN